MDVTANEISKLNSKLDAIEQLLEKDYEEWTLKEKQKFGNHEQLREERKQLREERKQLREERKQLRDKEQELLKQKTIMLQRDQNQGISKLTAGTAPVTPEQVLKDLLSFEVGTSVVSFARPSVNLQDRPKEEISYIVPLMKFVSRDEPAKKLFKVLDDYLDWKANGLGEAEKNIKFITVVGTSGKGKTTFARRFLDLPYTGKYPAIINDCRDSNRRYRVSCTKFDMARDAETQLSLLVLFEAFKHSSETYNLQNYITGFHRNFQKLSLTDVLQLITETFCFDCDPLMQQRLLIINLDETNDILDSEEGAKYLKKLFRILRNAADSFCLLTILSGTHSVDLFEQVKISQCKFVDIELSLIGLDAAKDVILGMTANPSENNISPYLEYVLTLCGGVGRYLEISIIQMSIIGGAEKGFKHDCYERFLKYFQTSQNIEILLEKVTTEVLAHYPKVFLKFASFIDLLSCYTLFQWNVQRATMINRISVGDLEKEGLVFLQPIPSDTDWYLCVIPFITLFWALKHSKDSIQIPLLRNVDSYFSPDESENSSLRIIMAKFSGLTKKNDLIPDVSGRCTVMLSDLFPLRDGQPDMEIKFHNSLEIMNAGQQINIANYKNFKKNDKCVAYLNSKGAPFTDAVIFCEPMIGIQEKQSVLAKQQNLKGFTIPSINDGSFQEERNKFPADGIFVLISDAKQGTIVFGDKDIFIDYENFTKFAGPLIALRKLYCINQLNPKFKRLKMK